MKFAEKIPEISVFILQKLFFFVYAWIVALFFTFYTFKMKKLILRILVSALFIVVAAYVLPNVSVDSYRTAIVAAVVLAIVNWFVGRILKFLTLPLNILTLWLVSAIISVLMIMLADALVSWFDTWWFFSTAIFAIVLAVINMLFWIKDK